MGQATTIEWTDATWSPLRARVRSDAGEIAKAKGYTSLVQIAEKMAGHVGPHCEHCSPGCDNCYSETNNGRCLPSNGTGLPFDRRSRDLVDVFLDVKILMLPLKWRKAQKVFVANQTDLFGEFVSDEMIDRVFAVMALCPHITFQVLTKRAERMREYFENPRDPERGGAQQRIFLRMAQMLAIVNSQALNRASDFNEKYYRDGDVFMRRWPLPNVWLAVSVEDQQRKSRIDELREIPAAVRFLSVEPLLEDIGTLDLRGIHWVIIGGESGPRSRPCNAEWVRSIVQQCKAAGAACFVKQLGAKPQEIAYPADVSDYEANRWMRDGWTRIYEENGSHWRKYFKFRNKKGSDMSEWPEDLRVREMPNV